MRGISSSIEGTIELNYLVDCSYRCFIGAEPRHGEANVFVCVSFKCILLDWIIIADDLTA